MGKPTAAAPWPSTMTHAQVGALRALLEMTQEQFAHAVGATVSTCNRWENGHYLPSAMACKAMAFVALQHGVPWERVTASAATVPRRKR